MVGSGGGGGKTDHFPLLGNMKLKYNKNYLINNYLKVLSINILLFNLQLNIFIFILPFNPCLYAQFAFMRQKPC